MHNELIVASAGTGKTYQLIERLTELLTKGAAPEQIVALTFSRAAAGEIFSRLIAKLLSDPAHEALLRRVIETQHLSMIGTIDAFLMKMVQAFPLELGLQGSINIMDAYTAQQAVLETIQTLLATPNDSLRTILREARYGEEAPRGWVNAVSEFITTLHTKFLEHPQQDAWGNLHHLHLQEAYQRVPQESHGELALKLGLCDSSFQQIERLPAWEQFKAMVESFKGRIPSDAPSGVANVLNAYDGEEQDLGEVKYNRKTATLSPTQQAIIISVINALIAESLQKCSRETVGLYQLLAIYEAYYDSHYRAKGMLTFDDLSRVITRLNDVTRMDIEYRFDSKFAHWALDEFQDTSHAQWDAIHNLVNEAAQDEATQSLLIVGDPKQAIYGWRGGDVGIIEGELRNPGYTIRKLANSYRYTAEIVTFLNLIFSKDAIPGSFVDTPAAERWGELWMTHQADTSTQKGTAQGQGYVCVKTLPAPLKDFGETELDTVIEALATEFSRVDITTRHLKTAVLLRNNKHGLAIAEGLTQRGIPATFEGESDIADTPAVAFIMSLISYAEHPEDTATYARLKASPLADVVDLTPGAFLRTITRLGLERALWEIIQSLPTEATAEPFVKARLDAVIRAAAAFEAAPRATARFTDFSDFLRQETERTTASENSVRVMTVHHSKGLGFDIVAVPIIEKNSVGKSTGHTVLNLLNTETWVLKHPGAFPVKHCSALSQCANDLESQAFFEALCVQYVAMTRAKKELFVLLKAPPKNEGALTFSRYVHEKIDGDEWTTGDPDWAKNHAEQQDPTVEISPSLTPLIQQAQSKVHRVLPSMIHGEGRSAAELFETPTTTAQQRGITLHEKFAAIEWLDAQDARTDFDKALVKTPDVIDLWREYRYELLTDDKWETGQFDRVVFTRDATGTRSATVYDFKTNAKRSEETEADFTQRLIDTYTPQMAAYRHAVSKLTGIPEAAIHTVLLSSTLAAQIPIAL